MNKKAISRAGLLILLLSALLWAGDPWKEKPYTAWTPREVLKIMLDSPWAKRVQGNPFAKSSPSTTELRAPQTSVSRTTTVVHGQVVQETHIATGPIPQTTGLPPKPHHLFTVVWFSAQTVKEAAVRMGQLRDTLREERAAEFLSRQPEHYIISVTGPHVGSFNYVSEDTVRQSAYLQVGDRQIPPARLEYVEYGQETLGEVRFYFPRRIDGQPTIGSKHKKVKFHSISSIRPFTVTFDLQRMRRDGVPDL